MTENIITFDDFNQKDLVELVDSYNNFTSSTQYFFKFYDIEISFKELTSLINDKKCSTNIWCYLLNYLSLYAQSQKNRTLPHFKFLLINEEKQNQLQVIKDLTNSIIQNGSNEQEKKIILINIKQKYFLIIKYHNIINLIDYSENNQGIMKAITNYVIENRQLEMRLFQDFLSYHSSQFYFWFIFKFISGQNIETIKLSQSDNQYCLDRICWLILREGFNQIENEIKYDETEVELNSNILQLEKQRALNEVQNLHINTQNKQQKLPNKLRLKTPLTFKQRQQQITLLNEKISYLKILNGEGDDNDILSSETFKIRMEKLNKNIDQEFRDLDSLKQNQLFYQSTSNQLLRNASEILKGKFNSQLFKGLGIECQESKEDQLKKLKELNYQQIVDPLMTTNNLPPGEFARIQKQNLIAMKYGIKISRDILQELRNGRIRSEIINFYCKFLTEFSTLNHEKIAFFITDDFDNLIVEQRIGKEINQNKQYIGLYDTIYFPIKQGQLEEYSIGCVDFKSLQIKHFWLCQQKSKVPLNSLQQIFKAWQIQETELIDELNQRQELQNKILQYLIYWIRKTANLNGDLKIGNMKFWTIQIEQIKTVPQTSQTAMYLLQLFTNFCLRRQKNILNEDIMREIIEGIICQTGIQDKLNNQYAQEYFKKKLETLL